MIAIDTNIIVQLLTKDDAKQYKISRELFETQDIYIPDTVILETEWVLHYAYDFDPSQICNAFRKLFGLPNVNLPNQYVVVKAIDWHENGLDFADALHLALSQNLSSIKTFNANFINRSKNLSSCKVEMP